MDSTHSKIHFGVSHEVDTLKGMAEILKRGVSRNKKKKSERANLFTKLSNTVYFNRSSNNLSSVLLFKNVKGELGYDLKGCKVA